MDNLYVDILYKELEEQGYISGKIDYKSIKLPTPAVIKREYEYKEASPYGLLNEILV